METLNLSTMYIMHVGVSDVKFLFSNWYFSYKPRIYAFSLYISIWRWIHGKKDVQDKISRSFKYDFLYEENKLRLSDIH